SYWSRLSTKAVQHSAGVIDLFFREAEANKNNPEYLEKELSLWDKTKIITSNVINSIQSFGSKVMGAIQNFGSEAISTTKDFFAYLLKQNQNQNTYEIPIDTNQNENQNPAQNQQSQIVQNQISPNNNQPQANQLSQNNNPDELEPEEPFVPYQNQTKSTSTLNQISTSTNQTSTLKTENLTTSQNQNNVQYQQCSFETNKTPTHHGVIINEIAWMGTPNSSNDEWIELKNISGQIIDVSGWQLIDKDNQIKINFSNLKNTKINPNQFILLERTDDYTLPNILADLIYVGSLSNTNEGLRLFDANCNLIDEVLASPSWPAGDSISRRTAERKTDLTWQTSENTGGTPKQENSIQGYGGGGSGQNNLQTSSTSTLSTTTLQTKNILISEIQINPTSQRFIELYNPNDFDIDLTGYYLQRKTSSSLNWQSLVSKTYFEGKIIKAKSYFVISRENLSSANIVVSNLTLSDSNSIQLKNEGDVLDSVGWNSASECEGACALFPQKNQSLQRKLENNNLIDNQNNQSDFETTNCPSPGKEMQPCSAEAPTGAFLKYSNTNNIVLSEIFFNPQGQDNGKEFIELYNPNSTDLNLTGWSLKIIKTSSSNSSSTTSTSSLANFKNTDQTIIPAYGFLLIGFSGYNSTSTPADIVRSTTLPNDFEKIILLDNQNQVIDEFNYKDFKDQNGAV
ncbi:MAG: lamin tail domain-containing protein, partial [Minisyncoccia bacterium]